LWRCRRLSFKFKTRSTGLSTDSLSRRQIGHRSKIFQATAHSRNTMSLGLSVIPIRLGNVTAS
jgi:hypothetical protein